jgi:hypothetical protein
MTQIGIVAYYGQKPLALAHLIEACQQQLQRSLGAGFQPYELAQVHATILGLEQVEDGSGDNRNFAQLRDERRRMDVAALLEALRTTKRLPITIQIGGFADRPYPFTSRGRTPFARSFNIQGDRAVLMGWPLNPTAKGSAAYPPVLSELRRAGEAFNVLHKYHAAPRDMDNDFYLRLGLLDAATISADALATASADLRAYLGIVQPTIHSIHLEQLALVAYDDERLPLHSTRVWSLDQPTLTPSFIKQLYQEAHA